MQQEQFNFQWQRRRFIVDHFAKVIYIQVLWDNYGEVRWHEHRKITEGGWKEFLPDDLDPLSIELRKQLVMLEQSGYTARPFHWQGMQNDNFAVELMTDIQEPILTNFG